jgi:radical SAM-linked protein
MRLRIAFSKAGALRYTGHLDLQKIWERTVRRAGLPLAYSQGFHPGPKIQLACALPLGFASRAELVDIWLDEALPGEALDGARLPPYKELFQAAAPPGLEIHSVEQVDLHLPALQTQVISAEYEASLLDPVDEAQLAGKLSSILAAGTLPRERRGKAYDLRPLIEELTLTPSPSPDGRGAGVRVFMRLAAREGATGRPEEILDVLGIPIEAARIERTRLIFKSDHQGTAQPFEPVS